MRKCKYCGKEQSYACMNTRDMEDFAIDGNRECFFQLARMGGGEKGLRYVIANIETKKRAATVGTK